LASLAPFCPNYLKLITAALENNLPDPLSRDTVFIADCFQSFTTEALSYNLQIAHNHVRV
jgi:hypothetical protein